MRRRGLKRGSWTGSPDNPSAVSAVSAMTGAIGAASAYAGRARAPRNAPLAGFYWPYCASRRCQSSLGYDPYDVCPWPVGPSPVAELASVNRWCSVRVGRRHLPRLNTSRRVSCTNPCTNRVGDLASSRASRRACRRVPWSSPVPSIAAFPRAVADVSGREVEHYGVLPDPGCYEERDRPTGRDGMGLGCWPAGHRPGVPLAYAGHLLGDRRRPRRLTVIALTRRQLASRADPAHLASWRAGQADRAPWPCRADSVGRCRADHPLLQ